MHRYVLLIIIGLLAPMTANSACHKASKEAHIKSYCKRGGDISDVLQRLVNEKETVIIDKGVWRVSKPIYLRSGVVIKGVSKNKSILLIETQAIIDGNRKFCLFTTAQPKALFGEEYLSFPPEAYKSKTFENIIIKDLTIDVNRQPEYFKRVGVSARIADLNVVRFENCKNCILDNCFFQDHCTPESFNNNAVVKLVESDSCYVVNCISRNCTFIQLLGGKGNIIDANDGKNSVGTWIETIGGRGHVISGNTIQNVYDYVSTIGINTVCCEISNNKVTNDNEAEISCLTLGHSQDESSLPSIGRSSLRTKADSCFVHGNQFETTSDVAILIQNGNNIIVEKNSLSSYPEKDNYAPATLYIHGQRDNLYGLRIINNTIETNSRKGSAFCGDCLNDAIIQGNTINTTCRYAIRLGRRTTTVSINNNNITVTDGEVISADDVSILLVRNNHFSGGHLNLHYSQLEFQNNEWDEIAAASRFELIETMEGLKLTTKVENNRLSPAAGVQLNHLARTVSKSQKPEIKAVSGNSYKKEEIGLILF